MASKPSDLDLGPSASATLVAHPYEGASGAWQKLGRETPMEMMPLDERHPRVDEIRTRANSGVTQYEA